MPHTRNQNKTDARHANALKRLAPVEPRWPACECVEDEEPRDAEEVAETRREFEEVLRRDQ
jgi:hypothetical protein